MSFSMAEPSYTDIMNPTLESQRLKKVLEIIRKKKRFLLTTHVMPDGDGLGSEMALHRYLKSLGKDSWVINSSATPLKFELVDPKNEIRVVDATGKLPKADVVLVLDTHDPKMLGPMESLLRKLKVPILYLDHHVLDEDQVINKNEYHFVDEKYGSTGELVYALLKSLKAKVDRSIALPLYVSILTDTGSFRFHRTTPTSHRVTAALLETGISPEDVYRRIYARDSFAKIRLFGHVLENVKTSEDERIAWLLITKKTRDRYNASVEDTEAFVNQLTLIEGVDVGILFREEDDGRIKVSLRGNRNIPILSVAKKFGGGGHHFAAGMRMSYSLDEAARLVCNEAKKLLKKAPLRTK
jgi:bifunctional oligoribonuclease and PAP phosphatase NrnA